MRSTAADDPVAGQSADQINSKSTVSGQLSQAKDEEIKSQRTLQNHDIEHTVPKKKKKTTVLEAATDNPHTVLNTPARDSIHQIPDIVRRSDSGIDRLTPLSIECQTTIIELLEPDGVLCIGRTSPYFHAVIRDLYLRRTHRAIARFGLDPDWVMKALDTTRSIICGAIPFAIILDEIMLPFRLEIICPSSAEETLLILLKDHAQLEQNKHTTTYNRNIYRGTHIMGPRERQLVIRVARGENAAVPVFFSPSTSAMNFVSAHGFFCSMPVLTLAPHYCRQRVHARPPQQHTGVFKPTTDRSTQADMEYPHRCNRSSVCASTVRSLYDTRGLLVYFPSRHGAIDDSKRRFIYDD
ncbi:hypothetical protein C8J57DRAFT_1643731 [Mycena rebaudengoi]|nr:hypothetical protein C8J57DRAFT_1643731 [Mycena rebaudengoi]